MARRPAAWLALALLILFCWACLSPLREDSREKRLELGEGSVPSVVRLTLGVQDVLVLQNAGTAPQVFGPLRILPGKTVQLPFEEAGAFAVACSAHPRGQLLVQVEAPPDPGLARLQWRVHRLVETLRDLPAVAPFTS